MPARNLKQSDSDFRWDRMAESRADPPPLFPDPILAPPAAGSPAGQARAIEDAIFLARGGYSRDNVQSIFDRLKFALSEKIARDLVMGGILQKLESFSLKTPRQLAGSSTISPERKSA